MRATKHLTGDELKLVLNHLNLNLTCLDNLMLNILIRTGVRGEELMRVTYEDIDIRAGTLQIRAVKNSSNRTVPVKQLVLTELAKRLKDRPLFEDVQSAAVKKRLRILLKRVLFRVLGQGYQDLSLHALRASFALNMYRKTGHDILLVKELLGHRNIQSTMFYVDIERITESKAKILKAAG